MKLTRFFAILCILGAVLTLSAQSSKKAYQEWGEGTWYDLPVYCDEVMVDYIVFPNVRWHVIWKPGKEGSPETVQVKGEAISDITGEVFKYRELDKFNYSGDGMFSYHYTIIGDKGHHYMGYVEWNLTTGEMKFGPAQCK
jgi:hypothetical protein